MDRRDFLKATAVLSALSAARRLLANRRGSRRVVTVTGSISAEELGTTLPHEHVMVDFIGAEQVSRDRYGRDQVFDTVLPHLEQVKRAGCRTLIECTPAYLGRDSVLLQRLSEASGLQILTNTGYYGARGGKYLPQHAHRESADELAERWLAEWNDGIEGTAVRPGFIKIGVDRGPLTEVNRKLVRAAARTHLRSGLTIACHTGDGAAAVQELSILREEGVDPEAWVWVHAQNETNRELHRKAAERGGWVEFDGIRPDTIDRHVELVQHMKKQGLLDRVLISHDAGWYSVGEPGGGRFRPYTTLFEQFLPKLKKAGFSDADIRLLTVENPAAAFSIRVRRR